MGAVAAFLWNSQDKSISYMIVDSDNNNTILSRPKKVCLTSFETFKEGADKTTQAFFNEINRVWNSGKGKIRIEYKIVGHSAPAFPFNTNRMPNKESIYVDEIFDSKLRSNSAICSTGRQLRSKLTGDPLKTFKSELIKLGFFTPEKGNAYVHHLWALIVHATPKTYRRCLKMLEKADDQKLADAGPRNR